MRVRRPVRVGDLQLVAQRQLAAGHGALEDAGGMTARQLDVGTVLDLRHHPLGGGPEGADDDVPVLLVRAQQAMRVVQVAGDDPLDVLLCRAHATGSSSSRAMPATGIFTQSGRLFSS